MLLYELSEMGWTISLAWIPSHVGIPGNEMVDRLAKEACSSGVLLNLQLPYSDFFEYTNASFKQQFLSLVTDPDCPHGEIFFKNYFKFGKNPWFNNLALTREATVYINRMRSNHYNLAWGLFRKNMADSPGCACNQGIEDLNHVFWECPRHSLHREILLNDLNTAGFLGPFNIEMFLGSPSVKVVKILHRFIKDSGLSI